MKIISTKQPQVKAAVKRNNKFNKLTVTQKLVLLEEAAKKELPITLSPKVNSFNDAMYWWVSVQGTKETADFSVYPNSEIENFLQALLKGEEFLPAVADTDTRMIQDEELEWINMVKKNYTPISTGTEELTRAEADGSVTKIQVIEFKNGRITIPSKVVPSILDLV